MYRTVSIAAEGVHEGSTRLTAADIRNELQDIALAWWPEFLLALYTRWSDEDTFTTSLHTLASCSSEEESLA